MPRLQGRRTVRCVVPGSIEEAAQEATGLRSLKGSLPHFADLLGMQRQRFRGRSDHCNADPYVRMLAQAERADRQNLAVRLTEDLEAGMGQGFGINSNLDADVGGLDHRGEVG